MKLMIATSLIALSASAAFAQDTGAELLPLSQPEIELLEAATIADALGEGNLVMVELDYIDENDPVYLAELESDEGFARMMIDGDSGDVLATESINAASPEALDAYVENYSTQAEIAEMVEMQQAFHDGDCFEQIEFTEDELAELEALMLAEDGEDIAD